MAKVKFKRYNTKDEALNSEIEDGSFIVTKDGHTYIDYGADRIPTSGTPDNTMSNTSENTVQNKVIKKYVDDGIQKVKDYVDKNNYSTEEVVIGTWMDKPLYRKIVTGNLSMSEIQHGLSNFVLRNCYGMFYNANTDKYFPVPNPRPNYPEYAVGLIVTPTVVQLERAANVQQSYMTIEIVLEYTKTTN